MFKKVCILSIDGGGIRGLIPAMVLRKIEKILDGMGKKKHFYQIFDLMAGTSTGGLISLALSTPKKTVQNKKKCETVLCPEEIVELYKNKGQMIFPPSRNRVVVKPIQAIKYKYDDKNFLGLLKEVFGDAQLEQALTNILISSYDTERREPHFFSHSIKVSQNKGKKNFLVRDIARATSAAPTYFKPAYIKSIGEEEKAGYSLIDGGIFVNNPSVNGYIEAAKIYPRARKFLILSLGTGVVDRPYNYNSLKNWGYIEWVAPYRGLPLLSMMMDGQSDNATHLLSYLPEVELYRFDISIKEKNSFMDDTSPENISYLCDKAEELIETNRERLIGFCKKL